MLRRRLMAAILGWTAALVPPAVTAAHLVPAEWSAQEGLWQVRGTTREMVAVTGEEFAEALRLTVRKVSAHEWDVQARLPTQIAVEQGQTVLVSFHARIVGAKAGLMSVLLQQASEPYATSFSKVVELSDAWQAYVVAGKSGSSFSAGAANILFNVGGQVQTVEIGGLTAEVPDPATPPPAKAMPTAAASRRSYFELLGADLSDVGKGRFIAPDTEDAMLKTLVGAVSRKEDFKVENLPFTMARRAVCKAKTKDFWGANVAFRNRAPVRKGETVYLTFFIRAGQAPEVPAKGPAHIDVQIKQRQPFKLLAQLVTDVGERWTRYQVAGHADKDYPAEALEAIICFGHKAQVIEVGGLALAAFGPEVDLRRVPGSACNAKR